VFLLWFTFAQVNHLKEEAGEVLKYRIGLPPGVIDVQPVNSNNLMAIIDATNKIGEKLNPIIANTPWIMPVTEMPIGNRTRNRLKDTLLWLLTFSIPADQVLANYRVLLQDNGWQLKEESNVFLLARRGSEVVTISYISGGGTQTQYAVTIKETAMEP